MPNNILKAQIEPFNKRVNEVYQQIRAATRLYYDTRKVELFFSTPMELEIMDEFMQWADTPHDIRNPTVSFFVNVPHPCAKVPMKFPINFDIDSVVGAEMMFWPKRMTLRTDVDMEVYADFMHRVEWMVEQRMGCLLLSEVTNYLVNNFKTWEQIAYVFPPLLPILRGMDKDFRDLGRRLENQKSTPQPPHLEVSMRKKLRHVTQFWAAHELLETLHKFRPQPSIKTVHIDMLSAKLDFEEFEFSIC
jgi:hypothetical protein